MPEDLSHPSDFCLVQRCLEGEEQAISEFERKYQPIVIAYLRKRGANEDEANQVAGSVCADLLGKRENRLPRLATYEGRAALKTWLIQFAMNRWFAFLKAKKAYGGEQVELDLDQIRMIDEESDLIEAELPLIDLLKEALEAGFQSCSPEDFVMLHLAYMDQLHLHEVASMFKIPIQTLHNQLKRAKTRVAKSTMRRVRELDPYLELKWKDFKILCKVANPSCLGIV